MQDKKYNPRNEQFSKNVAAKGYCCPVHFFVVHLTARTKNKAMQKLADVSRSTIDFNKKKLAEGRLACTECEQCRLADHAEQYLQLRESGAIGAPKGDRDD